MKFLLCKVDNDYVELLNKLDSKVQYHHGNHDKPYLGVLFSINEVDYFVPLSFS
ncbi:MULTISPECIES: type III toxin-antitoxin system ToxN/AbiQ family toxin [unclassified Lactococcus]|uniref:type III toxin-antitoxin system ToxN/AbiQ family toxin n=1 Tax=unclassified Lactococcus TaxID=2643510 RepID=UPI0011C7B18B|nr:hypothetical protein [Lactococcus sp. dk101]TXK36498.1 hypothetical protein FVP42_11205 [Lactococcus sp. dk310]TXK47167.1 hypothetical protein FVP43_10435 [Lactococcus sp. dk322]